MSTVAEAAALLRTIAEPRPVGDTVKAAINRAAKRVSRFLHNPMSASRAEDLWREEARAVRAEEMDALRRAAGEQAAVEAQHVYQQLTELIARAEILLRQDPDRESSHDRRAAGRVGHRPVGD